MKFLLLFIIVLVSITSARVCPNSVENECIGQYINCQESECVCLSKVVYCLTINPGGCSDSGYEYYCLDIGCVPEQCAGLYNCTQSILDMCTQDYWTSSIVTVEDACIAYTNRMLCRRPKCGCPNCYNHCMDMGCTNYYCNASTPFFATSNVNSYLNYNHQRF